MNLIKLWQKSDMNKYGCPGGELDPMPIDILLKGE
jgi:hypothetical protein